MQRVNLIPAPRQEAMLRRRAMRRCVAACAVFSVAVLVMSVAGRGVLGGEDASIEKQLASVAADIDHAEKATAAATADLAVARSSVAANRHILAQPDWSLLMALLGRNAGDSILLRSCTLRSEPVQPPAGAAPLKTLPMHRVLHLSGLGKSNQAVSQFIVRLENTNLFSKVTFLDTARETFLSSDATAFRIDCLLDDAQ